MLKKIRQKHSFHRKRVCFLLSLFLCLFTFTLLLVSAPSPVNAGIITNPDGSAYEEDMAGAFHTHFRLQDRNNDGFKEAYWWLWFATKTFGYNLATKYSGSFLPAPQLYVFPKSGQSGHLASVDNGNTNKFRDEIYNKGKDAAEFERFWGQTNSYGGQYIMNVTPSFKKDPTLNSDNVFQTPSGTGATYTWSWNSTPTYCTMSCAYNDSRHPYNSEADLVNGGNYQYWNYHDEVWKTYYKIDTNSAEYINLGDLGWQWTASQKGADSTWKSGTSVTTTGADAGKYPSVN